MHHDRLGLAFDYPDNWSVDTDASDIAAPAVTVSSPDGAFWSLSAHAAGTDPDSLSRAVLDEMRREYRDLDSESVVDEVGGHPIAGFDLNFYCLDLTNTAHVRAMATPAATYVVFCQAEDREWDRVAPVFEAMTASFIRSLPRDDDDE
ncbi:MAG: hypothetical protein ACKOEX_02970 [Planctomycetia bacterium]